MIFAEKHCGVFLLLSCDILHEINPPKKEKTKGAINNKESRCTGNGNKTLVRQRKQRKLKDELHGTHLNTRDERSTREE